MEVAALGLKVEGVEGIDRAAASLDGLAAAGVKAEKSTQGVGKGSSSAKPSVDALAASADKAAQAEARLAAQAERAGMSVGAMKAALRGVPAQFTDIATSLQGGMSPLTVFLQQGGQLKDMFGGAGSAARALGGYVLGLVNPFTVAAAGAAALGLAYFQGSKEQDAFMVSMAKTGNAAGLTTSGLKAYAEQISATSGTQGKAAESLNIFIESGVKAGAGLARLTETAIAWEKATGEGVDKVAAKYVALQGDPLKAALKLNEGVNFLTLSVYEQVKSLEEQGKTTDAAKVAMDALDSAMAERSKTIQQNLGSIQRAWNGITGAAKTAWDAMLNIGRPSSLNDQLLDVEKQLERLMGTQGFGETEGGAATGRVSAGQQAKIRESIRVLQDRKAALMGQAEAERWSADATKKNSEAVAAKAAWDKIVTANASKQEKMEIALANVRERAAAAGITGKELEAQLAAEREKYADKTKKSTVAVNAAKTAYESLIVSINEKIAATKSELASGEKQSESDRFRARYQQELTTRSRQFTEAQKKKIESDIEALAALEKQLIAAKALEKAWADDAKALESYTKKQDDYLKTVTDAVAKLEQEEEAHKLAAQAGENQAQAIQQIAIARLEEARAQMLQGAGSADEIERINQEIAARQKLLGLLGTAQAREANEKAAKDALKEWEKTSQLIGDTLADYIMGGGKDAATYLKRLFSTLVLQPVVQAAFGGITGSPGSSMSGGGSASSMLSNFSSGITGSLGSTIAGLGAQFGSTAATAFGSGIAAGGQLGLFGGGIGQGASLIGSGVAGSTASGLGTIAGAAGPWLAGAAVLLKVLKGFDDSGTPHSGAGAIYSAAGGLQTGAGIYNQETFGLGHPDEYSEAMQSGVSEITKGLAQTLDAFSVAFGKTAGYSVATAFADDSSKDGAWGSLKIADEVGKVLVDWGMDRESKFAPREFADGEAGYKEYLSAVAVDVKNAFVAMDLPGWADRILTTANDIDTLNSALQQIATVQSVFDGLGKMMEMFSAITDDMRARLLAASGGVEALASNAGAFYQSFYTEGERALKQRELQMAALGRMGLYIDPAEGDAAKELFRKTVQDAMGSGQVELAAQLLAMSDAFASTADYAQGVNEQLEETARSWVQLGHSLSIFSDISFATKSALIEAAGGFDVLQSSANDFYQGFYSDTEKALNDRDLMMRSLSDSGLYIDPAEGDAAKELFRKTVEEAMGSGQTQLAAELLSMSGLFLQTAEYAQQVIEKARDSSKAVADERYSLESSYLQVVGETDELRARELNALDASNRELQKMIWARQDEAEAAAKAAQKMADTQRAIDSVTSGFSGLRETITLDQLGTDEAKYGYFKAQADSLTRMLPQLQDQEAITRAINEIQSLTSRAYGTLDDAQKIEMGDEFLQYLAKTEDLALKNIERTNKDQADATGKAVGDAVAKEVGRIVDAITRLASDSGQISRETVDAIRRLSTQTGNTVVGTGQKYAEVNA